MHSFKATFLAAMAAALASGPILAAGAADPALRTDELRMRHNADGTVSLQGRMHKGMGPMLNMTVPNAHPGMVRRSDPAGVDHNGNPVTVYQKGSREIILDSAYDMIRKGLVKPQPGPKKDQLKMWQEKNEAARKHQEEHGRITTKTFIHPGTTPEESALINAPDTALVINADGTRRYVNERIQKEKALKEEADVFAECGTCQIEPEVKQPERMSTAETITKSNMVLRRKARGLDIKEMQNPQDVDLKALFPDMDMGEPDTKAGKPVSRLDVLEGFARLLNFVVNPACAEEAKTKTREKATETAGKDQTEVKDLREPQSAQDVLQSTEVQTPLKFFGTDDNTPVTIEYTEEQRKRINDFFAEGLMLQRDAEAIRKRVTRDLPADGKEHQAANLPQDKQTDALEVINPLTRRDENILAAVETVKEQADPELYAKFEAEAKQFAKDLLSADSLKRYADVLRELAAAYPEVQKVVPDIEARIDAIDGSSAAKPKLQTYVFISQSLGEETLKSNFERYGERDDIVYVMIGVAKDMGIADGIKWIQTFASQFEPQPNILIDPVLFERYGIKRVPAVVIAESAPYAIPGMKKRKTGKLVAKALGLTDDKWVKEQIEKGEAGDLGVRGETYAISEVDMLALMKERVAKVDWQAKRDAALRNFWKTKTFDILPTAQVSRTRIIDPTIYVENDIRDLAGRYIRRAGEKVNPLDIRPFTKVMIVFNAASQSEVDRLQAYLNEKSASDKGFKARLTYIATAIDKNRGWDAYKEISDRLDAHIHFLVPEIKDRWQLQQTPAVIYADNAAKYFIVEELGPSGQAQPIAEAKTVRGFVSVKAPVGLEP